MKLLEKFHLNPLNEKEGLDQSQFSSRIIARICDTAIVTPAYTKI